MQEPIVRITQIEIKNFKNIIHGNLSLENSRKDYKASIVGIYGQNGSGKTAVIESIDLLKYVLCGKSIPNEFADYINMEANEATLSFTFKIMLDQQTQVVKYQFSIKGVQETLNQNTVVGENNKKKVVVFNEVLKCPILSNKQTKIGRLIDTTTAAAVLPDSKRQLLIGDSKDASTDLMVAKKFAQASSTSFIFSQMFLNLISENKMRYIKNDSYSKEFDFYYAIINSLVQFGNHNLFVIRTDPSGLICLDTQSFVFKLDGALSQQVAIKLSLNDPVEVEEGVKEIVEKMMMNLNTVLTQIVPGLTVNIKDLGVVILPDGKKGNRIQLMSKRNNIELPLKYESHGIKKIISILQLLIVVYNQPSATVAIDELDSGVFEYLLGEIVRIISEKGKGQLIFTSHNLRPLETLDKGFVAFTTTNPNHRFIRLTNVKRNNNLRDFYYRDIMLGEQSEELYEHTHNSEIALAFREAGRFFGT